MWLEALIDKAASSLQFLSSILSEQSLYRTHEDVRKEFTIRIIQKLFFFFFLNVARFGFFN